MNLRELSKKLGLSQTTVSRALNGFPEVSEETRARVRAAADLHDYRPSPAARRLATGRSGTIGMHFPQEGDLFTDLLFTEFLRGCVKRASASGYDLNVSMISGRQTEEQISRCAAWSARVDAVVLAAPLVNDPRPSLLRELGVPFIVHGRTDCNEPYGYLDIDSEAAFFSATRLLTDLRHRRIAFLNGDPRFSIAADREKGFRKALASRDLSPQQELTSSGRMNEENGRTTARSMLSLPMSCRPTAFLCSSIALAAGVKLAVEEAGLEIGHDIALITHDDRLHGMEAEAFDPPLTATQSSIGDAGGRITELCIDGLRRPEAPPPQEVWPVNLVVRRSTMPARA